MHISWHVQVASWYYFTRVIIIKPIAIKHKTSRLKFTHKISIVQENINVTISQCIMSLFKQIPCISRFIMGLLWITSLDTRHPLWSNARLVSEMWNDGKQDHTYQSQQYVGDNWNIFQKTMEHKAHNQSESPTETFMLLAFQGRICSIGKSSTKLTVV